LSEADLRFALNRATIRISERLWQHHDGDSRPNFIARAIDLAHAARPKRTISCDPRRVPMVNIWWMPR
jgi:hypothetical protein